jgi:hypothetical protein
MWEETVLKALGWLAATVIGAYLGARVERQRAATHIDSERQLEIFKLAATEVKEVTHLLAEWRDALDDYGAETTSTGPAAFENRAREMELIARRVRRAGILLPPELDERFMAAVRALDEATKAISGFSILQGLKAVTKDSIDDRFRKPEVAEAAVIAFVDAARAWKTAEWPLRKSNETHAAISKVKRFRVEDFTPPAHAARGQSRESDPEPTEESTEQNRKREEKT